MAEKLSRTKRYEDLRNRLDEETTAAQEDKINQQTGFARLSRTQHKALAHANDLNVSTAPSRSSVQEATNNNSPVMEDLLGEVKRYNIDQGNRITDDTQINILRQLDQNPSSMHRNTHIVPMEEEKTGGTMKIQKPEIEQDVDGVATYMPNQKLTRINPIQTKPEVVEEPKVGMDDSVQSYVAQEDEDHSPEATYTNIVLGSQDILVDDTADTDHLSLLIRQSLQNKKKFWSSLKKRHSQNEQKHIRLKNQNRKKCRIHKKCHRQKFV